MNIEDKVHYYESVETVNSIGLKKWFKIGYESVIQRFETPDEAYKRVEGKVREWAAEKSKGAEVQINPEYAHLLSESSQKENFPPKEQQSKNIIRDINSCVELNVLESYRLIAKTNEEIQSAYDNKLKELS
jgi:hypothetical protein